MKAAVMMAIGTRLSEADSSSWYMGETFDVPPTKLIHIDINQEEIGRNFNTVIGAICDAKAALEAILAAAKKKYPNGVKRPEKVAAIAEAKSKYKATLVAAQNSAQFPMRPERILKDLREALPKQLRDLQGIGGGTVDVFVLPLGSDDPAHEPSPPGRGTRRRRAPGSPEARP